MWNDLIVALIVLGLVVPAVFGAEIYEQIQKYLKNRKASKKEEVMDEEPVSLPGVGELTDYQTIKSYLPHNYEGVHPTWFSNIIGFMEVEPINDILLYHQLRQEHMVLIEEVQPRWKVPMALNEIIQLGDNKSIYGLVLEDYNDTHTHITAWVTIDIQKNLKTEEDEIIIHNFDGTYLP